MQKNRAFQLIQILNSWETNHLKQFLNSPFFNRRKDVIILLEFLISQKETVGKPFSKQELFEEIYPNEIFSEQKMYLLVSYLSKLIEKFLAFREIEKDQTLLNIYQAKAFRRLKKEKDFKRTIREGKKILEKQSLRDSNYLQQVYNLEFEFYNSIYSRSRTEENNLQRVSDAFDLLYIAEKLKQFCFQLSHQNVFKKEYDLGIRTTILKILEEQPNKLEHPAIGIYFFCYKAISTGEEQYFQKLRTKIQQHFQKFSKTEIRDIYLATINFCIKRMNTGEIKFIREGFELYRTGLENEYLLENGEISRFTFINTVLLSVKLEKFNWAEDFIQKYSSKLAVVFRKSIHNYMLSRLRYEQKRYSEAMNLLSKFETTDALMYLDAKLTLLIIYYELEELDALDSLLESMRMYVQRKKVLGYHRDYYMKIIRLTKKLTNLGNNQNAKNKFKTKVLELKGSRMQNWFLKQIE